MSQPFKRLASVGISTALLFSIAACSSDEGTSSTNPSASTEAAAPAADQQDKKASLGDWAGVSKSIAAYLDDDDLQDDIEKKAKETGQSVDDFKAEFHEKKDTGFDGLVIDDEHINFVKTEDDLDSAKASDGAKYTYDTFEDVEGEHSYTWFIFKGEDDAPYKYVLLMQKHGEATMPHYHMLFGDTVEEAKAREDYFPTIVDPEEVTKDQILNSMFPPKK